MSINTSFIRSIIVVLCTMFLKIVASVFVPVSYSCGVFESEWMVSVSLGDL